jgi:membrane protease YdiL (CAAX protease family)
VARVLVAGAQGPATSLPAAAVFTVVMLCIAVAGAQSSGSRSGSTAMARLRATAMLRALVLGVAGGAVLVLLVVALPGLPAQLWPRPSPTSALPWTLLVVCISVAEEVVFRGVLYDAVARIGGAVCAAVVCALAFALVHVPLYGWRAVPLDVGAGLWLGGLRMLSGGVAAPAIAHAVADCGAWLVL